MNQKIALMMLSLVPCASTSAQAFDGKRKGFVLGGGLGLGLDSYTQSVEGPMFGPKRTSDRETRFAIATDFKIGGGINEQWMLYYHSWSAWFSFENALNSTVTILNQIGGLGARYYPDAQSAFFVAGSMGLSYWTTPFEDNSDGWLGFGILGGVGYEFVPHWSVEASIGWGNPSKTQNSDKAESNALAFLVTVNGLAF